LLPYILSEKYIHILALEMASPRNQHHANCIGALSFPIQVNMTTGQFKQKKMLLYTAFNNLNKTYQIHKWLNRQVGNAYFNTKGT